MEHYEDGKTSSALQGRVLCLPYLFERVFPEIQRELLPALLNCRNDFEKQLAQERRGYSASWTGAAIFAAECGDYETLRNIPEKPTVLVQQLDYKQELKVIVLGLFHLSIAHILGDFR